MNNREPHVLYEVPIRGLALELATGQRLDVSATLTNGRANYVLFQHVVARCTGLSENSEGAAADLVDDAGRGYEVKSYKDPEAYPFKDERFHTAASSTFPANNRGPQVRGLLRAGDYAGALRVCRETGYDKNDFYVYVNTGGFTPGVPLRYCVLPTNEVLGLLEPDDPRLVRRRAVLDTCTRTTVVSIPARSGDN